jgi:hypothetical protein
VIQERDQLLQVPQILMCNDQEGMSLQACALSAHRPERLDPQFI